MRVFVDSSVLFLAVISPAGRAAALVRLAAMGRLTLCASSHVIEEARRNIVTRSRAGAGGLDTLVQQTECVAEAPATLVTWAGTHGLGAGDAPVLAAAAAAKADGLVTADRLNFGHLFGSKPGGVTVVSLCEALRFFLERGVV